VRKLQRPLYLPGVHQDLDRVRLELRFQHPPCDVPALRGILRRRLAKIADSPRHRAREREGSRRIVRRNVRKRGGFGLRQLNEQDRLCRGSSITD
jgi:hypothetical protein